MIKIEKRKLTDLKEYEGNSKIHTEEQVLTIVQSIQEFGFNDPIAVDENNEIIEGHGRLQACRILGKEEVPVIVLNNLSEIQKRAYRIAHNKLNMITEFDFELLQKELKNIITYDSLNLNSIGFTKEELASICEIDSNIIDEGIDISQETEKKITQSNGETIKLIVLTYGKEIHERLILRIHTLLKERDIEDMSSLVFSLAKEWRQENEN